VRAVGYNRFPSFVPKDKATIDNALFLGRIPIAHGIKTHEVLGWFL